MSQLLTSGLELEAEPEVEKHAGRLKPFLHVRMSIPTPVVLNASADVKTKARPRAGGVQAITLREIEGLSYGEIAELMDCPIGTVRSRIFRAREAIASRLRPLLDTRDGERW